MKGDFVRLSAILTYLSTTSRRLVAPEEWLGMSRKKHINHAWLG